MNDKNDYVIIGLGGIVIIWFALLIAPYISNGIFEIIKKFPEKINNPFDIEFCKDSLKTVFIFLLAYSLGIGIYISSRKNYRRGEEYGSAVWGIARIVMSFYIWVEMNNQLINMLLNY